MGMDVYGLSPQIVGEKPKMPDNWDDLSHGAQEIFYESVNLWETNNPGVYFRANCWSWRPIHAICDFAINIAELPFNTYYWGSNDGKGLTSQDECNVLADGIELYLILNGANLRDQDDTIYLCLGGWTTSSGKFMPRELEDELNETYPTGTILYNGVVTRDGTLAFSAHSCSLSHIQNFIKFLRNCGGFEIW